MHNNKPKGSDPYIRDLSSALIQAHHALLNTSEYQRVRELEQELREAYKARKELPREVKKELVVREGFECRTGHRVVLEVGCYVPVEPYTHLVLHKTHPPIKEVVVEDYLVTVVPVEGSGMWSEVYDMCLGVGSTEEDAWEDALRRWSDATQEVLGMLIPE